MPHLSPLLSRATGCSTYEGPIDPPLSLVYTPASRRRRANSSEPPPSLNVCLRESVSSSVRQAAALGMGGRTLTREHTRSISGWIVGTNWPLALKSSHASDQWRNENRASRDLVAGQTDGGQNNRGTNVSFTHTDTDRQTLTYTATPHCVVEPVERVRSAVCRLDSCLQVMRYITTLLLASLLTSLLAS